MTWPTSTTMPQDQDTQEALISPTPTKLSKTGETQSKLTRTSERKWLEMSRHTKPKLLQPRLP